MATYVITQGIQGPEGAQGPPGSGGSNDVYFAFQLLREDNLAGVGFTYDPGVSLTAPEESDRAPSGARFVIIKDDETYESYIGDGSKVLPYENPQLSTFGKSQDDLGGQSVLLNVLYDTSKVSVSPENMRTIFNTLYLMNDTELQPIRSDADEVSFDNTTSGFNAINVQEAIDEMAAAPEVVKVYVMATPARVEASLGAVVTSTEITFAEAPPGVFRMLVGSTLDSMVSYTTDGTTVAPVDTEQIMGSGAKFVFVASDIFASDEHEQGGWSVYGIDTATTPDMLMPVGGAATDVPLQMTIETFTGAINELQNASGISVDAFTGILNSATPPSTVQEALDIVDGLELGASPYTPADSANWTGADPTTIAEAIDRIAAALGPIA